MASSTLRFRLVGEDDASAAFLRVAASSKLASDAMSQFGTNTLGLTRLLGAGGLIPIAAGAAASVVELGTALGVAGGAAGAFGLSAGGMLKQMVKQQQQISATQHALDLATKGTTTYKTELHKLTLEQSAFNQQFGVAAQGFEHMHTAWNDFLHATAPVTQGVLAQGFDLIASVLPKLVPVSNAAGHAIGSLLTDLQKWVNGPGFHDFLYVLQYDGPRLIKEFGHIVGNVVSGLGGILSNFVQPGMHATKTLDGLTAAFAKWGHSQKVSNGIDGFLKYVSENSPQITASLKALAEAAPKIAVAFGNIGSLDLHVVSKFLTMVAGLPQGAFNVVVEGLFGIAAASKAIAIATAGGTLLKGLAVLASGKGFSGPTGGAGGALGGLAGKGVVPVYVTNKGFGPGGIGGGVGAGTTAAEDVAGGAGATSLWRQFFPKLGMAGLAKLLAPTSLAVAGLTLADRHHEVLSPGKAFGPNSAEYLHVIEGNVKKVSTAYDALSAKAAAASRSVDLIGPAAQHSLAGGTQAADHFNSRLNAIQGGKASAAMDLIGHSAAGNFAKASAGADQLKSHIDAIQGKNVTVGVNGSKALATLDAIAARENALYNKTVTITTMHASGGRVKAGMAAGGTVTRAGLSWVGEREPELLSLPRDAQVYPLRKGGKAAMGDTYVINVHTNGLVDPQTMAKQIQTELIKLRRNRGGAGLGFD